MHGPTDDEVRLGLALGVDDFQRIGIDSPGVSAGPHGPHPRPRGDATAAVLEAHRHAADGRRSQHDPGGARVMGADRQAGSIEAGRYAGLIAVGGDPLRHITVVRDPKLVSKQGRRYK